VSNRSQIATGLQKHRDPRLRPYALTEHGAIMAANVLNSPRAVQMSVFVVRAFLKMRAFLGDKRELAKQLAALEKELKQRLDVHEAAIVTILQRVMDMIDPPLTPQPSEPRIGFKPDLCFQSRETPVFLDSPKPWQRRLHDLPTSSSDLLRHVLIHYKPLTMDSSRGAICGRWFGRDVRVFSFHLPL
jgi:hypothetical protein